MTAVTSGLAIAVIVAPNSLVALEKPLLKLLSGKEKRRDAKRLAIYLKQQKLVEVKNNEDGSYQIIATEKGKQRAHRAHFDRLVLPTGKWDRKWRIVMFDIPEKYKTTRDYVAGHMKRLGFQQLQRSVFVFPYPVDDFVAMVKDIFPTIAHDIIYIPNAELDVHNAYVKKFKHLLP